MYKQELANIQNHLRRCKQQKRIVLDKLKYINGKIKSYKEHLQQTEMELKEQPPAMDTTILNQ